jgi:transposase
MLLPLDTVQVYLAIGATDMRKSINGLSMLVDSQLELDPLSGHLFCFCNRRQDIVKILYWDRNGFCLWHKRLEQDRFKWPNSTEEVVSLQGHELSWLLNGLSIDQCDGHRRVPYTKIA